MTTKATETTPASVEEALLESILREPDDDGLRLILADYLEDHGDPERALFIRDQIAMEAKNWGELGASLDRCLAYAEVMGKEDAWAVCPEAPGWHCLGLCTDGLEEWDRGVRRGISLYSVAPRVELFFRRGLVWRVDCECATWKMWGPGMAGRAPVQYVHLTDVHASRDRSVLFSTSHPRPGPGYGAPTAPWLWPWMDADDAAPWVDHPTEKDLREHLSRDALRWALGQGLEACIDRAPSPP